MLKTLDFSEIRTLIAAVEGRCADRLTSYLLYERHARHFNKYFFNKILSEGLKMISPFQEI